MPTGRKKKTPEMTNPAEEATTKTPEATSTPEVSAPEEPEETGPKVVSLNRELSAVALAVRGAQIMVDMDAYGFMDEDGGGDAPLCISSLLSIVGARIDLLQAVIRQEVNPALLWGPHNAVREGESRPDGDVYLLAWNRS